LRTDARDATIAAGVLALIVYGSLYPFQFHASLPFARLLELFLHPGPEHLGRGDLISNILLYLPLGFFAVRTFQRGSAAGRVIVVTILAAMLAISIELTQFYDDGRTASVADASANSAGALIGAIAGVQFGGNLQFAALLLLAWIGDRLLPFVPTLHAHFTAQIEPFEVFRQFALWLAAATLLDGLIGIKRSRSFIAMLLAFVLAARLMIEGAGLSGSELTGGVLAVLAWIAVFSRLPVTAVTVLFVIFVIFEALRPFHFLPTPRAFHWAPFIGFIEGSREGASRVFLEKTYIYGTLVWLLARAGCSYLVTTISAASLVLGLRLIQVYLPGRSAEISDAVMVVILAGVMALLHPSRLEPYPPSPATPAPR